MSDDQINRVS
jgi:hypothetical protein